MELVSVNVGMPRDVEWHGRPIRTSIWKSPVEGHVTVTSLNLEGDQQSDLSVRGGEEKAVYVYSAEHYEYWGRELTRARPRRTSSCRSRSGERAPRSCAPPRRPLWQWRGQIPAWPC